MNPNSPTVQKTYNQVAEDYAAHVTHNFYNGRYERPGLLSLLPDVAGLAVLDAGCGPGLHSQWLVEHGAKVTAVDLSPAMVALTQARLGSQVSAHVADLAQPLPFLADHSFDIIMSSLTLHYILDWSVPLGEFHRLLRPNGLLAFSTHHPIVEHYEFQLANYFDTFLMEDEWLINGRPTKMHFYHRPLSAIITALKTAGFQLDDIREPLPIPEAAVPFPQEYQKLTTKPQFLFIRAIA